MVTPIREEIEKALEKAGLGKKFDKEIPLLAVKIYRVSIKEEAEYGERKGEYLPKGE